MIIMIILIVTTTTNDDNDNEKDDNNDNDNDTNNMSKALKEFWILVAGLSNSLNVLGYYYIIVLLSLLL